jgi:processive 1,2-diacylglycerol beta-glucosyltransferase
VIGPPIGETNVPCSVRILVGYVTAGAGHRRAAEAIAHAVGRAIPQASVRCVDVLTDAPGRFHAWYAWSYLFLVRYASWVWRVSYHLLDWTPGYRLVQPVRRRWNLWIGRRFVQLLKDAQPDVVLATHFLPADLGSAGRAAGWLTSPLVVVITDLHPHRFWIARHADATVVGTADGAAVLEGRGIPRERIHVLGIPVGQAFGVDVDATATRARLGLDAKRRTVLVTSGGTTVGQFESVVRALRALEASWPGRAQLLVVCGEDEALRRRLEQGSGDQAMPMRVFGFVDHMAQLMAASDLVVAKAGGLTISEALARRLPLVLYHVIPGQEWRNADYVVRHGAAIMARRPAEVARRVRALFETPERLALMREAAASLGRPRAAEEIVEQVVKPLLARRAIGTFGG